jgi:hypothetical protein
MDLSPGRRNAPDMLLAGFMMASDSLCMCDIELQTCGAVMRDSSGFRISKHQGQLQLSSLI